MMNDPKHDDIEAPHPDLSKISGEMRALRIPEVDADKIERGLFAKLADEPAPDRARGGFLSLPLAAAAIAAAALGYLVLRPAADVTPAASLGASVATVAGATADPTAAPAETTKRLVAQDEELKVVREGLLTLVLEPGASARVVRDDDVFTLDLERGAVRAYVVPRTEKERVIVLSNGVRVAVHGTVFRVARTGAVTDVDLLRGTISLALDGQGDGARAPQVIDAPRGFTVNGGAFEARSVKAFSELAGPWLEGRTAKLPGVGGEKPASRGPDEALRGRVTSIANECFQRETSRLAPGIDVQVQSTIAVTVGDGGRVTNVAFGSPLAPGLEACIRTTLKAERGTPGVTDVNVSLARRLAKSGRPGRGSTTPVS